MGLETGTYISDLVTTNPAGSDDPSQGDDHLRLLKTTLKTTFPNVTGAVTATHTELNALASGVTFETLDGNGDVGPGANQVAKGNHNHASTYEPAFTKNGAFNKNFGTASMSVSEGDHSHPASKITSGVFATSRLGTGTANSSKLLRGDRTWADFPPAGSSVSVLSGTVAHNAVIPLPGGYTEGQCKWMVSMYNPLAGGGNLIMGLNCSANGTRTVTSTATDSAGSNWPCSANYIIIGVK